MAGRVFANPNVPPINQPVADVSALTAVTIQLRQGMLSLGGQLGGEFDRAVTLNDLVLLGLVSEQQLVQVLRR